MSKSKYPKEVPVLEGRHFTQDGLYFSGRGTCCLVGWMGKVFCGATNNDIAESKIPTKVYNTVKMGCSRKASELNLLQKAEEMEVHPEDITEMNDKVFNKKQLADIWNESMRKLGYTEISE